MIDAGFMVELPCFKEEGYIKKFVAAVAGSALVMCGMTLTAFGAQWKQDAGGWWWQNDDLSYPVNTWLWLDGNQDGIAECYYFNENGYCLMNAATPEGYTVDASGAWIVDGKVQTQQVQTADGWKKETNGTWSYYEDGQPLTDEWKRIDEEKYYFDENGTMVIDFYTIDGEDYYFNEDGTLQTKSFTLGDVRYTVQKDGTITDMTDLYDWYEEQEDDGGEESSVGQGGYTFTWNEEKETESESVDTDAYAQQVFDLVNQEREAEGLSPLEWDDTLAECAALRAEELTETFSHNRPDGSHWSTLYEELGGEDTYRGENIAMGYASPKQVMNGWMNSSGHRANILRSTYTKIGVGCYSQNGTLYWVQNFSREN